MTYESTISPAMFIFAVEQNTATGEWHPTVAVTTEGAPIGVQYVMGGLPTQEAAELWCMDIGPKFTEYLRERMPSDVDVTHHSVVQPLNDGSN